MTTPPVAAPDHKLGSAFIGQLYFQVGQMEGPKVTSEAPEARSSEALRGWALGSCSVDSTH